ncbi:hypothetical protein OY671_009553, partial [Metschnikowia pulcherrima]
LLRDLRLAIVDPARTADPRQSRNAGTAIARARPAPLDRRCAAAGDRGNGRTPVRLYPVFRPAQPQAPDQSAEQGATGGRRTGWLCLPWLCPGEVRRDRQRSGGPDRGSRTRCRAARGNRERVVGAPCPVLGSRQAGRTQGRCDGGRHRLFPRGRYRFPHSPAQASRPAADLRSGRGRRDHARSARGGARDRRHPSGTARRDDPW